jgi:uncharacterized Zn-finger protein
MKARIEFEIQPIRHIAVQCPYCENWFHGRDISNKTLHDIIDVEFATYDCPICGHKFDGKDLYYEEMEYEDVYKGCLTKKEFWD